MLFFALHERCFPFFFETLRCPSVLNLRAGSYEFDGLLRGVGVLTLLFLAKKNVPRLVSLNVFSLSTSGESYGAAWFATRHSVKNNSLHRRQMSSLTHTKTTCASKKLVLDRDSPHIQTIKFCNTISFSFLFAAILSHRQPITTMQQVFRRRVSPGKNLMLKLDVET
jgi:hypothetical protein